MGSVTPESKIYVAGAGGLVGSSVVEALKGRGFRAVVAPMRDELDLTNEEIVREFFQKERPEYVILAAARVGGIEANRTKPAEFLHENLAIQQSVIWGAQENGVSKLLFLGSSCIYPREAPQPMKEEYFMTGKLEPTNEAYAVAKIAGIMLCEKIFEQYGKPFISCMPANVYGERDHFDFSRGHVIPALMRRMHEAKVKGDSSVAVWGTGNARREFLHVRDLADAVVFLLQNYDKREFLNVGTGIDISIKELAELMKKVVGFEGDITLDGTKPDGMPQKLLDVSKLTALGWKAQVGLEEGLTTTYEWFKNNIAPTLEVSR